MTAHREKPTITPEHIEWFATYLVDNPAWGIFHVALGDGNWKFSAADHHPDGTPPTLQERIAADWFRQLTPSQRRRLRDKAAALTKILPSQQLVLTVISRAC